MSRTKVNMIGSKSVFIKYLIKILLFSTASVLIFSSLLAFLLLKLDLSLDFIKYISVIIIAAAAFITSYFSVSSFSNNGAVLGIISSIPMIIYSLINTIIYSNDWVILIIKIALIILLSALSGNYSIKKRKKIRVK